MSKTPPTKTKRVHSKGLICFHRADVYPKLEFRVDASDGLATNLLIRL